MQNAGSMRLVNQKALLVAAAVDELPPCTVAVVVCCADPDAAVASTADATGCALFEVEPQPVRAIDPIASANARHSHWMQVRRR